MIFCSSNTSRGSIIHLLAKFRRLDKPLEASNAHKAACDAIYVEIGLGQAEGRSCELYYPVSNMVERIKQLGPYSCSRPREATVLLHWHLAGRDVEDLITKNGLSPKSWRGWFRQNRCLS
jgi:hypothetical protein